MIFMGMKKIYINPTLEVIALVTSELICQNPVSNENYSGSGNNSFGGGAPKRRPF